MGEVLSMAFVVLLVTVSSSVIVMTKRKARRADRLEAEEAARRARLEREAEDRHLDEQLGLREREK